MNIKMKECREAAFAAWIANIGRFYKPGPGKLVKKCGGILEHYLDVSHLLGIVEEKEGFEAEAELVKEALSLSLCESEVKEKKTDKKNLTSVFSRITVQAQENPGKRYYALAEESAGAVFPKEIAEETNLQDLMASFEQELILLEKHIPATWEAFIIVFDTLCRKYMWCITASDYEGEDISLYNQSRIAAAIAVCLCQEGENPDKKFKLAVGDFSGIQKYVFSVATVSESGVAKRLRARSFYVDVTVSVIAQAVIERFGLTQNHILMLTGGKFYLLLPNTLDSDALLEQLEEETSRSLFALFKGQVAIHLAWITMSDQGLKYYSESVTELLEQLGEKKNKAFYQCLVKDEKWDESQFVVTDQLRGRKLCPSCRADLTEEAQTYCKNCEVQTEIGGKLPKVRYIAYYNKPKEGAYHIYGDYWIDLWHSFHKDDAFLIERINVAPSKEERGYPVTMRYMANYIPTDEEGNVKTFSDIAETAPGVKKLAVLKADVDNLGYIFADGLRCGTKHFGTISRVNTMSRLLEVFFSGYINQLISECGEFKNTYSVFSGGDDLFLIGPWNVMPKLAVTIEERFRVFAAANPALTISAAVSIFHPKEHIANLAELSEGSLKRVKDTTVEALYPEKDGRDGVCFMGELYSWADLEHQLAIGERLSALIAGKAVGISALRRIAGYSRMYRKFLIEKDVMSLMFEPLFHYDRQRNYEEFEKKKRDNPDMRWFMDEYIEDLKKNAADYRKVKRNLYFAQAAAAYAMNLTKEERKDG